jgi:hypothetical protein
VERNEGCCQRAGEYKAKAEWKTPPDVADRGREERSSWSRSHDFAPHVQRPESSFVDRRTQQSAWEEGYNKGAGTKERVVRMNE